MHPPKGTPAYDEWYRKVTAKLQESREKRKGQPGYKHTEATKAKIGAAGKGRDRSDLKGKPSWNKGIPITEEAKERLRNAKLGKPLTEEHKAKISAAGKGREISAATRAKFSTIHKGKPVSAATRAKLKAAYEEKPVTFKGPHSPETRKRLAETSLARWEDMTDEEKAAKIELLRRSSENIEVSWIEEIVAKRLDNENIVYERQKRIGWYRVDFYVPATNTVIEVNGCYWHCCEVCGYNAHKGKREADEKRYAYLHKKGYTVTVIWEHELPRKRPNKDP